MYALHSNIRQTLCSVVNDENEDGHDNDDTKNSIEMLPNSHSEDEGEEGEVVENQANTVCISENLMH
jgi:hypothetical protein